VRIFGPYRRNAGQGFSNHGLHFYRHAYFPPGTYLAIFHATPSTRVLVELIFSFFFFLIRDRRWPLRA